MGVLSKEREGRWPDPEARFAVDRATPCKKLLDPGATVGTGVEVAARRPSGEMCAMPL
jgi:hypothetical protein